MSVVGKPGYKETAVGWIPQEWECPLFGELLRNPPEYGANASAEDYKEGDIRYLRITDITEDSKLKSTGKKSLPRDVGEKYLLSDGDILLARSGSVGRSLVYRSTHGSAAFAGYLLRFRLGTTVTVDYVSQYLQSDAYWSWVGGAAKVGAQPNINAEQYKSLPLPVPPIPEQQEIAAILTAVDDKLDLIARQISATKTLKQGLMQTLFTRGVGTPDARGRWHPHTAFQDSELGRIPVGWSVEPLDALSNSISVGIATSTTEHYVGNGVPLIRNQNIKEDFLDMSDLLSISASFDESNKSKRVQGGDILTVRTGYPGVSCVVPEGLGYLQTFTTLITKPKHERVNAHFVSLYFNSPQGKERMLHEAAGGAQQNINAGNLKKLLVPVPTLSEQKRIAEALESVSDKLRSLTTKQTHYQSLKRGLMQKLLTGEWRVKVSADTAA